MLGTNETIRRDTNINAIMRTVVGILPCRSDCVAISIHYIFACLCVISLGLIRNGTVVGSQSLDDLGLVQSFDDGGIEVDMEPASMRGDSQSFVPIHTRATDDV